MKVFVKIHPNSSQEKVVKISDKEYEIWIKEKPVDGKANESLIKLLKKHFGKEVKITAGFSGRKKIVEVSE